MQTRSMWPFVGLVVVFCVGFGSQFAHHWFLWVPSVPDSVLEQAWSEQPLGDSRVMFDAPWPLELESRVSSLEGDQAFEIREVLSGYGDGLAIHASRTLFRNGLALDLEAVAKKVAEGLDRVGQREIELIYRETSIMDGQGFQYSATVYLARFSPMEYQGVVFWRGNEVFEIFLIAKAEQPAAAEVWARLQASIRAGQA